jgi:hypothetical protein
MLSHYVYLLQEREFIKTNESIYKIGMTTKEQFTRFEQYPKGSLLLLQLICKDCKKIERDVLLKMKEQFKCETNIGREYFSGDYTQMMNVICDVVRKENKSSCAEETKDNIIHDDFQLQWLSDRIQKNLLMTAVTTTISDLYNDYCLYITCECDIADHHHRLSLKSFSRKLCKETSVVKEGIPLIKKYKSNGVMRIKWRMDWVKLVLDLRSSKEKEAAAKKEESVREQKDALQMIAGYDTEEEDDEQYYDPKKEYCKIEMYQEWSVLNHIEVIITDTANRVGYWKHTQHQQPWKLIGQVDNEMEYNLESLIENQQVTHCDETILRYNTRKIVKDVLVNCFQEKISLLTLQPYEYCVTLTKKQSNNDYLILNLRDFSHVRLHEFAGDKIATMENVRGGSFYRDFWFQTEKVDIAIVDEVFDVLLRKASTKPLFKSFIHSLLLPSKKRKTTAANFCDCSIDWCLLREWTQGILLSLGMSYVYSDLFFESVLEFETYLEKTPPLQSIVFINGKNPRFMAVAEQVKLFSKKVSHVFVYFERDHRGYYNVPEYRKFLKDNKERLSAMSNGGVDLTTQLDDWIFYGQDALMTHFLKWCCAA